MIDFLWSLFVHQFINTAFFTRIVLVHYELLVFGIVGILFWEFLRWLWGFFVWVMLWLEDELWVLLFRCLFLWLLLPSDLKHLLNIIEHSISVKFLIIRLPQFTLILILLYQFQNTKHLVSLVNIFKDKYPLFICFLINKLLNLHLGVYFHNFTESQLVCLNTVFGFFSGALFEFL